jgi:hypothetical protein
LALSTEEVNEKIENFEDWITNKCAQKVMKGWDEEKELLDELPRLNKEFARCSEDYYNEVQHGKRLVERRRKNF